MDIAYTLSLNLGKTIVYFTKIAQCVDHCLCLQFHLYTILVFDAHWNGVPIAWVLSSLATLDAICLWLSKFCNAMLDYHKSWQPSAFLVDDAERKLDAIRFFLNLKCWLYHHVDCVFQCSTLFSSICAYCVPHYSVCVYVQLYLPVYL